MLSAPFPASCTAIASGWPESRATQNGCRASTSVRSPGRAGVYEESAWRAWSGAEVGVDNEDSAVERAVK